MLLKSIKKNLIRKRILGNADDSSSLNMYSGIIYSFNIKKNIDIPASMLLLDELGLTECFDFNPLNTLIAKLDKYFYEHFKHKKMKEKFA